MSEVSGNTGGGATTGATALGGVPAGGSTPPVTQGGDAGTRAPAGSIEIPSNWKDAIPQELRDEPSLKVITDFNSLVKSYVSGQKMVGADKIVIPSKHATDDDWRQVFTKLGVPEKVEEYSFAVPNDAPFDEKFIGEFKTIAHKAGIMPKQAEGLVKWFAEASNREAQTMQESFKAKLEADLASLKTEWGQAYQAKVAKAATAAMEFGGKELIDLLNETGLGNSPKMIKAFAKIADLMSEDKLGGDPGTGALTPKEAASKINQILGDRTHPYYIKDHPGHKAAVEEVQQLFVARTAGQGSTATGFVPYSRT